jgi:hypothetical protein
LRVTYHPSRIQVFPMSQPVRRAARGLPIEGVELTEERLAKMIDALHATPQVRRVAVYDLSRTGVAIIDLEPMELGRQFNMLIPRPDRRPLEVLCLVRHCRPEGVGYLVGAQFGVSWLSAVGARLIPAKPSIA